jgi:hypothetical protein
VLAGWKTLDIQSNSLAIDLSKEADVNNDYGDYWADQIVRPKQVIYWLNFVTEDEGTRTCRILYISYLKCNFLYKEN